MAGVSNQITGTIGAQTGPPRSLVTADRAAVFAKGAGPAIMGVYTVLFDQPTSKVLLAAAMPQGDGFGSVVVNEKGQVKLSGQFADGSKLPTFSTTLSNTNFWSLWVPFKSGNGALAGRIQFRDVANISDLDGSGLLWFKPQDLKKPIYPGGWPKGITTNLVGSRYVPNAAVAKCLDPSLDPSVKHPANLLLTGGNISGAGLTKALTLDGKKIEPADPNVVLTLTTTSGFYKGSFLHPVTHTKATMQGAVLQKQKMGSGFFFGDHFNTTGAAVIK